MIIYLIYSTTSLGLLLLFYHLFLEKEKMHKINRGYLIFSLLFSLTIPLIPIGLFDVPINELSFFDQSNAQESGSLVVPEGEWIDSDTESTAAYSEASESGIKSYWVVAWFIYIFVSIGLFIRLIRIVHRIQLKADRNEKRLLNGCEIILMNDDSVPHTFFDKIFLNKKSYLKGEVPEEVIIHEMTHVRQKHSLDILLIEFLKILFWFNPILYLYKKAILLNHEFLADEAVISQGKSVKGYQNILLKTMLIRPAHSLTSTLNYSLTKKRLQMMTQSKSSNRSILKLLALIPLFAAISLLPGCDSTTTELSNEIESVDEVRIEIMSDSHLLVNGNRMGLVELENYLSASPENPDLVHFDVNPDADFGTVTDVQSILRKYEALRISYSTNKEEERNKLTLPPAPPVPPHPSALVETKNLMQILMNSQGMLLMNDEPAELNEVSENIKQFVGNSSADTADVIISVKTDPYTPYDQYIELLDEIKSSYDKLRNKAAESQFGLTYRSLEKNSTEKKIIDDTYPMKLSVTPPDNK